MMLLEFIHQQFSEEQFSTYQLFPFHTQLNSNINESICEKILQQKKFNKICKEEINFIAHYADKANIRIAFMKGLFLAEDLYISPETRLFNDIDILIDLQDLKAFLKICKNFGYSFLFMDTNETIEKGIEQSIGMKMHHYHELSKTIYRNGFKVNIKIEVHTQIYSRAFHQINIPYAAVTKSALNSSILVNDYGFKNIYILEKSDDLLALILHTVKHFFESVMESLKSDDENLWFFNMRQLLDIDLFIEKHDINYVNMFNQAIEWDAISELVFICKIIETYKPNEFKEVNLDEIYQKYHRKFGFVANYIDIFINNFDNLFELLLLSSWDLAKYIMSHHPEIEYPVIICQKGNDYHYPQESCFVIDEQADVIKNRFGTHHMDGRQIEAPNYWCCQGSTRWTEEYLFFKFEVKSSYKLNLKNRSCKGWMPTDSIDFYFLKSDANEKQRFIQQIEIPLQIDDNPASIFYGKPFIKIFDAEFKYSNGRQGKYTMWNEESFVYNFEISENKSEYILEIGFKWDMLRDCIFDDKIIFDIGMVTFDDEPPRRNILRWASTMNYSDFHDITTFGCLKIVDSTPQQTNE